MLPAGTLSTFCAPTPPCTAPADLQAVLNTHNSFRASHGVPPLSWSTRIAASAQAYSANCVFEHSHTKGLGENLSSGYRNWAAAIRAWMEDEEPLYKRPGFRETTGHYTQVGGQAGAVFVCMHGVRGMTVIQSATGLRPCGHACFGWQWGTRLRGGSTLQVSAVHSLLLPAEPVSIVG